jgi:hypothetical protein
MALDPSIALGIRPLEVPNQLAQYAQMAQVENAQQQNALAQFQLGAARRAEQGQNALGQAYGAYYGGSGGAAASPAGGTLAGMGAARGGINYDNMRQAIVDKLRTTAPNLIPAELARINEMEQKGLLARKTQTDIDTAGLTQQEARLKLATTRTAQFRDQLNRVNSPEAAAQWTIAMYNDPQLKDTISSVPLEAALAEIPKTPQEFNVWKNQNALGMTEFIKQNKPTTQVVDQSGQKQMFQIPGLGGAPTSIGTYADVPLPANVQNQKIQIAQQSRPPLQPVAPTITTIEDPNKPGSFLQVDARTYQGGGAGSPGVIGGARPSATAEKLTLQRTQMGKDLGFAITQLSDITKDGGLIDQSTGSGAGRLTDIGAGFVGIATPGAIAIGKIAPIADLVLKMVPRFEGPQSNKDTQSYKEAAGQLADPTLPTAIRKEAGKTVLRIMTERKNQFVTTDMAAEGAGAAQVAPPAGFVPDQR